MRFTFIEQVQIKESNLKIVFISPKFLCRYQQIKDDEIIARTLQSEEDSPELRRSEVTPSAPPASEVYESQENDATIALELQNIENDEHGVRMEKERLQFEERKENERLKMKQVCVFS